MKLAGKSDVGQVRSENQDRFCAAHFAENDGFALVCDGMGGASGGAMASATTCDKMGELLLTAPECCAVGFEKAFLQTAIEAANREVFEKACAEEEYAGMGTTAVCALVRDGQAHICHVGDSRCYLLRGEKLQQLTKDHSYVQELVDCGTITQEEAKTHPKRNAITRAIGVDYRIEVDYTVVTVVPGDVLLLCTDGLTRSLSTQEIEEIFMLEAHSTPEQTVDLLIKAANAAGGADNSTAVLLYIEALAKEEQGNG